MKLIFSDTLSTVFMIIENGGDISWNLWAKFKNEPGVLGTRLSNQIMDWLND